MTAEGLGVLAALLAGLLIASWRARSRGFTSLQVIECMSWSALIALVGAKMGGWLVDWQATITGFKYGRWDLRCGFFLYGGLIPGVLTAVFWLRRRGLSVWKFLDVAAPAMAIAQGIGKLGCFMNGCCYGKPAGLAFLLLNVDVRIPRHPVQLYEMAGNLFIGAALLRIKPSSRTLKNPA